MPFPESQLEAKEAASTLLASSPEVADVANTVVNDVVVTESEPRSSSKPGKKRATKSNISPTADSSEIASHRVASSAAKTAPKRSRATKAASPVADTDDSAANSSDAAATSLPDENSALGAPDASGESDASEVPAAELASASAVWARDVALRPSVGPVRKSGAPAEGEFERVFALWRETGDPQLRDRLILMHRNLVSYLARRFTDRGEMYEDIIQQGLIGLINALDHFDPKRGVRFATFATPTIVGEIRRYFRDKTWSVRVPRRLQELHQTINRKIEALTQELGRSPTYAEIARSLGVEEEQVVEALEMAQALDPASLDEPSAGEDGSGVAIVDQVGGNDVNLERLNEYSQLKAALEQLTPRQQTVLQLAYFEGFSQAEIARHIKVSPMHVSRLQRRALAQLREILEETI